MSDSYARVFVGTDGSNTAQCAVYAAGSVSRAVGVSVTIVTGWYRDRLDELSAIEMAGSSESPSARNASWATDVVVDGGASLRAIGHEDVRTATPEGGPSDVLLKLADEQPGSLVVVGTVGLDSTADRLLGNIPHQLTHHAHSDLLLVSHRDCDGDVSWDRIALATDGSRTSATAVQRGLALARALGAHATLLTVASSKERGQMALNATGIVADDMQVAVGRDITGTLVDAAKDYDILVLGNKGMSGPSRLLGSVANSVTHHLPTDLLLVNTTR